jgi:hypothetical protein
MLLAVLFSADEAVLATALACDHQFLGDRYWSDVQGVEVPTNFETAYVTIDDADLAELVLDWESQFSDGHAAATAIEDYSLQRNSRTIKRQAA